MYFLIRQGVSIKFKTMFHLMLLQSVCSNTTGLKFWEQTTPGPHAQALLHVSRELFVGSERLLNQFEVLGVGEDLYE